MRARPEAACLPGLAAFQLCCRMQGFEYCLFSSTTNQMENMLQDSTSEKHHALMELRGTPVRSSYLTVIVLAE